MITLTDEWIECFDKDKANGKIGSSIFWRLVAEVELPMGVDEKDPRVVEAIEHIKSVIHGHAQG